jgi:hypothetical protein
MSGRLISLSEQSSASRIASLTVFNGGSRSAASSGRAGRPRGRSAGCAGGGSSLDCAREPADVGSDLLGDHAPQEWEDDAHAAARAHREPAEQQVATLLSDADAVANEFVTGTHLFQDESHLRGLLFSALVGQAEALQTWAHDARAEVETWATLAGDAGSRQRGVERMRGYLTARKRVRDPETTGGRTAPPRRLRHRA